MPKPLAGGMNSYLHIKSFLGQEKTIEGQRGWSPFSCKDKVKNINNWLKNKILLSIDQKKELEMTPALEKEGLVSSTSSRSVQGQAQNTSEETERSQEPLGKRQRQSQLAQTLPTRVQDPQIGNFISGKCLQYFQNSYGIHSQGEGKNKQDFPTQIIQEMKIFKTSINVELGKIDAKLTTITLGINDLKKNDRHSSEWYKSTISKLDSITNTCDRTESKCQVQDDEIGNISISHINEQLTILRHQGLEIISNTNQFATHLAKIDSERQKLKNEIITNVEKIHNNYGPHMPRHSAPLTEYKPSVKPSLTPFLGENAISGRMANILW
ncbi:hypothetical protein O181_094653 [Austropuccinia psidii MF-1]|uniref:Uncharacterized protein n=1 Tax=Austropuccinia psidii MF-1 TaxID=1389203 RepID=A0A9Q3J3J9_9BASI|nr:hypothetical protein [Austropuccinia psidii MF-1]